MSTDTLGCGLRLRDDCAAADLSTGNTVGNQAAIVCGADVRSQEPSPTAAATPDTGVTPGVLGRALRPPPSIVCRQEDGTEVASPPGGDAFLPPSSLEGESDPGAGARRGRVRGAGQGALPHGAALPPGLGASGSFLVGCWVDFPLTGSPCCGWSPYQWALEPGAGEPRQERAEGPWCPIPLFAGLRFDGQLGMWKGHVVRCGQPVPAGDTQSAGRAGHTASRGPAAPASWRKRDQLCTPLPCTPSVGLRGRREEQGAGRTQRLTALGARERERLLGRRLRRLADVRSPVSGPGSRGAASVPRRPRRGGRGGKGKEPAVEGR